MFLFETEVFSIHSKLRLPELMANHMQKMTTSSCGGIDNKGADKGYQHIHQHYKQKLDAVCLLSSM